MSDGRAIIQHIPLQRQPKRQVPLARLRWRKLARHAIHMEKGQRPGLHAWKVFAQILQEALLPVTSAKVVLTAMTRAVDHCDSRIKANPTPMQSESHEKGLMLHHMLPIVPRMLLQQ